MALIASSYTSGNTVVSEANCLEAFGDKISERLLLEDILRNFQQSGALASFSFNVGVSSLYSRLGSKLTIEELRRDFSLVLDRTITDSITKDEFLLILRS
jgi:GH24 family phage-related lysozyme (muramidase)